MLESVIPQGESRLAECPKHGTFTSRQVRSIRTSCPQCQRDQISHEYRQHIESQVGVRRMAILSAAKIPTKYATAELVGEHAKTLRMWAEASPGGQGALVIFGTTGTGKTHLACALLRLVAAQSVRCRYVTAAGFLTQITSSWDGGEGHTERHVFAEFVEPTVLVLDDVGANSGSEALRMKISQLLDERYLQGKSTVLLSNLTPNLLQAEIGDRAYSRMLENLTQVTVTGKDRRRSP